MARQSAKKNYTLNAIRPLAEHWLSPTVFRDLLARFVQRVYEQTRKRRRFYQRLLPPLVVVWMMLYQRLSADHSCDAALSAFLGDLAPVQVAQISESTSAYCQARQRLPLWVVEQCLYQTAAGIRQSLGAGALWCGRQVCLLDGSTLRLAAETELHGHYGVSSNQHGENHWPILRVLAAFHLFSGGVERVVEGPYSQGELSLASQLLRQAGAGWVWVGDANFGAYRFVQLAKGLDQDVLVRLRKDRIGRMIDGKALHSGEDRAVVWTMPEDANVEADLPTPDIAGRLLYLRVEQPGFRPIDLYLFTTLTDAVQYPTQALLALYGRRWNVELNLRHVKTTLDMEELRGKSVDIVRKELLVGLLAYTLIRGVMGLAALQAKLAPLALSFARCWRRIRDTCPKIATAAAQAIQPAWTALLERLAKCTLPKRKQARFEPRQVWGKPRVFPSIKGSRHQAREAERLKLAAPIS